MVPHEIVNPLWITLSMLEMHLKFSAFFSEKVVLLSRHFLYAMQYNHV